MFLNRARARQASWLYVAILLVAAILCIVDAIGINHFTVAIDSTRQVLLLLRPVLALSAFGMLVRWLWRAYGNLHQLPAIRPGYPTSWALWAWFIPVSGLIRPYTIVREVWLYTQQAAWGQVRVPPTLVGWWWAAHLASGLLSWVIAAGADSSLNSTLTTEILIVLLDALPAVLMWQIIQRIAAFEEALAAQATSDMQL